MSCGCSIPGLWKKLLTAEPWDRPECAGGYECDAISSYLPDGNLFAPSGTALGDIFAFNSGRYSIDLPSTNRWSLASDTFVDACVDSPLVLRSQNYLDTPFDKPLVASSTLNDNTPQHFGLIYKYGGSGSRDAPELMHNDIRYLLTVNKVDGTSYTNDIGFDWTIGMSENSTTNTIGFWCRVTDRDIGGDNNITIGSVEINCTDPGVNSPSDRYMAITVSATQGQYNVGLDARCAYDFTIEVAYEDAGVLYAEVVTTTYDAGATGFPLNSSTTESFTVAPYSGSQYARPTEYLHDSNVKVGKFVTDTNPISARRLMISYLRNQSGYSIPDYC